LKSLQQQAPIFSLSHLHHRFNKEPAAAGHLKATAAAECYLLIKHCSISFPAIQQDSRRKQQQDP